MPSEFESRFESDALPVIREHFGFTVLRHPNAIMTVAAQVSVAPIDWIPYEVPFLDDNQGRRGIREGKLYLADSVECLPNDHWTVNGEVWQTKFFGTPQNGERVIILRATSTTKIGTGH